MTMDTTHLPILTGSDKQVAWATSIRAEALIKVDAIRATIARASAHAETLADGDKRTMAMAAIGAASTALETWASRTAAREWIDGRALGILGARDLIVADGIVLTLAKKFIG